ERQRAGLAVPTQNTALNLRQTRKLQTQLDTAVLQLNQLLRGMPAFLADIIGNQFVETNHDFKFALAGDDAEGVAQAFFQGKLLRTDERFPGQLRLLNPGGNKSANVISQMTIREEKPLAVDVGQVIWVDDAGRGLLTGWLAISQDELPRSGGRFGHGGG